MAPLREPVQSAQSLAEEVEESSAGVSPVLPVGGSVRSAQHSGVVVVSDGPQLGGHPPDLQLLLLSPLGASVMRRSPERVLVLGQQVGQRSLPVPVVLLRALVPVRVWLLSTPLCSRTAVRRGRWRR